MSTTLRAQSVIVYTAVVLCIHGTQCEKCAERKDFLPTYSRPQIDRHRYGEYDRVQDHVAYSETIHGYHGAFFIAEPGAPTLRRH